MAKADNKEPISDLREHNIKREEEVRAATKRLDEYLVEKFDLNKPKSEKDKEVEKTQKSGLKISEASQSKEEKISPESKQEKKAEEKKSETKVTEK
ncbi:hypothetical protein N9V13_03780 [Betaproteobacteria bacterium]|nr:hypothetical protein [Betaproteobacteria bacterium]